jgi:hypothetical protein
MAGIAFYGVYGQLFPIVGMAPGGKIRANFGDQPFEWSYNQIHGSNNQSVEAGITTAEEAEEGASEAPDEAIVEGGPSEKEVSGTEIEE